MEAIELYKEETTKDEEQLAIQATAPDKKVHSFSMVSITFGSRIPEFIAKLCPPSAPPLPLPLTRSVCAWDVWSPLLSAKLGGQVSTLQTSYSKLG